MWVNIWCMLDWIIGFGHKTVEIRFLSTSAQLVSAQNETLLWLAGMNKVKHSNPLLGLAFDGTTWRNEELCT